MTEQQPAPILAPVTVTTNKVTNSEKLADSVNSNYLAAREAMSVLIKAKSEKLKLETEKLTEEFNHIFDMCRLILEHPDSFQLTKLDITLPSYTYHCKALILNTGGGDIALTDGCTLYVQDIESSLWLGCAPNTLTLFCEKARTTPLLISERLLEIIQEATMQVL